VKRTVIALCVVGVCACEHAKHDQTVELSLPKVTVHVIDPGAEPRAPLRYHGNGYQGVVYKATYSVRTEKGAENTITRSVESTREVGADGVYHEHQRELDGDHDTIDSWFDAREIHPRPSVESGPKVNADSADPALQEIFPDEPVGVGATWHEDITIGANRASVDVELVARDGDHARERITYHSETRSATRAWPMHHDGTATLELDLGGVDPSVHVEETYVIDKSNGKVGKGDMTMDLVKQ
jgi:hypothetical protein